MEALGAVISLQGLRFWPGRAGQLRVAQKAWTEGSEDPTPNSSKWASHRWQSILWTLREVQHFHPPIGEAAPGSVQVQNIGNKVGSIHR
jgi:hypothetical protein